VFRLLQVPLIALACLLVAAASAGAATDLPAPPAVPPTPPPAFAPGRAIVQWAPGADRGDRAEARAEAEVSSVTNLGDPDFQLVRARTGQSIGEAIAELEVDPAVAVAEHDGSSVPTTLPDDPLLGQLWGLRNTGLGVDGFSGAVAGADVSAEAAWARSIGDPATVVADIDSGYRFEHPDLANVAWDNPDETANGADDDGNGIVDDLHGADFIGANGEAPSVDGNPTDGDLLSGGHGVHTAGTIGAEGDNGVGITGVAQDVRIMPLRVCSRFPSLNDSRCLTSAIVAAIHYAGEKGARVANISLTSTSFSQVEVNAIAANPDVLFVISAGNDGTDNDGGGSAPAGHHYPCDFQPQTDASPPVPGAIDNIVCVAATDQADGLAGFSDRGATSVDLGAPGTEVLSTYPVRRLVDESFEADDFGAKWNATGAQGGFERTNEAPLASFGMSDSPGATPDPGAIRASTSTAVSLPPGFEPCTLEQSRTLSLGGGSYRYDVLLDGASVIGSSPTSSGRFILPLEGDLAGGGEVAVRFRYTAGAAPDAGDGVWLDDIELHCTEPVGQASGYEFLQGTSMAAPHVSGAAALLFSLEPAASMSEVRAALLAGAEPTASLAGQTVTGGRLDVAAAMDALEAGPVDDEAPAAPLLTATDPASPASEGEPRIVGSAEAESGVDIYAGASCEGSPVAGGTAAELAAPGIAVSVPAGASREFTATATDAAENTSDCSAPIAYTNNTILIIVNPEVIVDPLRESPPGVLPGTIVPPPVIPSCKVPKLAGKTLAQAKVALAAAGCRVGKVTRPRARPGRRAPALVVKSSSPSAGARAANAVVNLTLGPKPKRHRH
jgi:thermitase